MYDRLPEDYLDVIRSDDSRVTVQISVGTGIDNTAADDLTSISAESLPMSNVNQLIDSAYTLSSGLATFEANGIPTAPSYGAIAPPITAVDYPTQTGVWSSEISDADGNIQWALSLVLSKAHTSAISIHTSDVYIVQARLVYSLGGTTVRDITIDATIPTMVDTEITTYDTLTITVMKISAPYSHVRVSEVEFGTSITMSNSVLGDTVKVISEIDPLGVTMPLSELDFSLLNVNGEYDSDNPNSLLDTIPLWNPVWASFSTVVNGRQITVPMGRFYISDRSGTDKEIRITAQDARSMLKELVLPLTLSTSVNLGLVFEEVLDSVEVPHNIAQDVYSVFPDRDIVLEDEGLTVLQQIMYIQQYYGIEMVPNRDGAVLVRMEDQGDTAPALTPEVIISYPVPTMSASFNVISVIYGVQTYERDLRTSLTQARSALVVTNPLVYDQAGAIRIADKIQAALFTQLYDIQAIADASFDPLDVLPIAGRWTTEDPDTFRLTSIEWTFDGGFVMDMKAIKQ